MKFRLAISICLTAILIIIGLVLFNIERQDIREYEVNEALPDFKRAIARKNVQFVYVENGWGGAGMPLGYLSHALCYGDIATKMIGPVGHFDVSLSLQFKAIAYAKAYNALVLQHLNGEGKNDCLPGEDWDGAIKITDDYLHNQNNPMPNSVHTSTLLLNQDYGITLDNLLDLGTIEEDAVITRVCEVFKEHGIKRSFVVSSSLGRFICTDGTFIAFKGDIAG